MTASWIRCGRRSLAVALIVCAGALAWPRPAAAQPRLEVGASGAWWDGYALGDRRAAITGPQMPTGSPVTLFDTSSTVLPGPGAEVRIGWRLLRGVYAEATGGLGVNDLETRLSNDVEQAPATTVATTLTQITIEGGGLVEVATLRMAGGHLVPFASGGAGYLRQVHEDRVLIETGRTIYVGGGVKWRSSATKPRGLVQRLSVRADARLVSRTAAVDIDDTRRNYITVSAGVLLRLF
jgi:hypothetical protein